MLKFLQQDRKALSIQKLVITEWEHLTDKDLQRIVKEMREERRKNPKQQITVYD